MGARPVPGPAVVIGRAFLFFSVDPTIEAGAKLPISWELRRGLIHVQDSVGTSVVASLTVDGTEIWSSPPVAVSATNIGGDVILEGTGPIQETPPIDPNSPAARVLYAAGVKNLQLQVVGNGPHRDPFPAQVSLIVTAIFSGNWWQWNPGPATAAWKSAYSLSGVFVSSIAPLTALRATLVENNVTDNSTTQLQTLDVGPVDSGANKSVAFTPITQTWQWLDDITFLTTAPTIKNFRYTVQFNAQDPWGNPYQATSPALSILVSVPPWKINDQTAALGFAANAVALTVAAAILLTDPLTLGIAIGLFSAAALAYAAARAFANAAKDPPQPDPLYMEVVEKKVVEIPPRLSATPLLDALAGLYRLVLDIAAGHEALSVIRGRILGALNAKNRGALDRQVVRYREITKNMQELALQLPEATAKAIQTVQSDSSLDARKISTVLSQWKQTGVPQEVKASWVVNSLPEGVLPAIEAVVRQLPLSILTVSTSQQVASLSLQVANWATSAASQNIFAP